MLMWSGRRRRRVDKPSSGSWLLNPAYGRIDGVRSINSVCARLSELFFDCDFDRLRLGLFTLRKCRPLRHILEFCVDIIGLNEAGNGEATYEFALLLLCQRSSQLK